MPTFSNRTHVKSVVLLAILLPFVSLSQVKIKEKVEIQPKPSTQMKQLASAYNFFVPPLFIPDDCTLPLKSKLFITGTVSVSDDIGYGQSVEVGYVVHDYFNPSVIYDTPIAWKGRDPVPAGGNLSEGQKPDTLTLEAGTTPDVELLLWRAGFDGFGTSQLVGGESAIDFSFTGMRTKKDGSPAPVSGTAHATASVVPAAVFNGWKIQGWTYLWCGDQAPLTITPLDSSGAQYSPAHSEMMSGTFTVSVQAKGDYAYLKYDVQQGKQITVTIPQQNTVYLVLDTERGYIPDDVDTAIVTVTGGGKSKSRSFFLECPTFDHLTVVATSDTLRCGTSVGLKVVAQDIFNREITPPDSFNVTLELWYQGTLLVEGVAVAHDTSISYTLAHSGRLRYVAPDSSNDGMECGDVWIDVYRTEDWGMWGYTDLTFARSYCVTVTPSRTKLAPGDTAMLSFEKTGGQDIYDVAILTADTSNCGRLESSSGASGIALQADRGTVRYIAPKSITGDSIVVQIKAFSYGICDNIPIHGIVQDVTSTLSKRASAMQMMKKVSVARSQKTVKSGRMLYAGVKRRLTSSEQKALTMSIAKRTLEGTCPLVPTEITVESEILPRKLMLGSDPHVVKSDQAISLQVNLTDGSREVPTSPEKYTVSFVAGESGEGSEYAELEYMGSRDSRIDAVPYKDAHLEHVKFMADKSPYTSRFPMLIKITASLDGHEGVFAYNVDTLKGANTLGEYFSQSDDRWGDDPYDSYIHFTGPPAKFYTITEKGCALSSIAMVLKGFGCDVTPGILNTWMTNRTLHRNREFAGFRSADANVDWDYDLRNFPGSPVKSSSEFGNDQLARLDNNLSLGYPAMVQFVNPYTHHPGHWGVVTARTVKGDYVLLDPDHRNKSIISPDQIDSFRLVLPR